MLVGLRGQRSQIADRREARQERIGAAPRRDELRRYRAARIAPPDLSGRSNQLVPESLAPVIGSLEPVMRGSCRPRFSQSQDMASNWAPRLAPMKLPSRPCSGSGFEFVPLGFVVITLRRIIKWSIRHATPNKAPAVVRYPLHDLPASRVAPADMGAMGAAGVANTNVVKILPY